ncbi:DinB family protein [Paenibacillus sp. GSMTC-2017]|uniref:DinB family protein n=1 Tax=Paenibacillus sp. GSMTC-2017 TaxID=2794350 RepID=UPI0018D60BB2|nr:DinB family protein [Paenibacillus sp. GSMTC-2017]MBH5317608.1 DinB family protein [Paenibacillus sp. GSMTC-2017]
MSDVPVDIDLYVNTSQQLSQAIEGLTEEDLRWKGTPTQWSVTEVLAHLVDHSIIVSFRIKEILSGSEVRLPSFKQDEWVASQKSNEGKASELLHIFGALLHYNSLLFRRLELEDWAKTAINAKGDVVTLSDIIHAFISHVQTHLSQIARIKNGVIGSVESSCVIGTTTKNS